MAGEKYKRFPLHVMPEERSLPREIQFSTLHDDVITALALLARVARLAILSPNLEKLAKSGPPLAKFIFDS